MTKATLILFFFYSTALLSQNLPELIPFRVGDKFGYSNREIKIKISPRFSFALPFYGNSKTTLAKDSIGWFHINQRGDKISAYLNYDNFEESMYFTYNENGKEVSKYSKEYQDRCRIEKTKLLYVKDTLGEYLITEEGKKVSNIYNEINGYPNENYCIALKDSLYYILDLYGKELFPSTRNEPERYSHGLISFMYQNRKIFYDINNDTIFYTFNDANKYIKNKPIIEEVLDKYLQIRKVKVDDSYKSVVYDLKKGKIVSDYYSYLSKISKDRLCYRKKNSFGIINYKEKVFLNIEQRQFVEIFNCGESFKLVYIKREEPDNKDYTYDLYSYNGKFIKSVSYDNFIAGISNRLYRFAEKNDSLIIIDNNSNEFYSEPILLNSDNTILYEINGKWGLKKINGGIITHAIYDEKFSFQEGLALVKRNGVTFYIDLSGNEYKKTMANIMYKTLGFKWLF